MYKVVIEIETNNDAFQHGRQATSVAKILMQLSEKMLQADQIEETTLHDINGNSVGKLTIK